MKVGLFETGEVFQRSLQGFFNQFAIFIPRLLGALLILLIGWIIARSIKWAVKKLLTAINFEKIADKLEIDEFLRKGGVKLTSTDIFASLVYWTIMLVVLITFFNSLGLEAVSGLMNQVILFIPNIIVSCILLVVGMYAADFVKNLVSVSLKNADFSAADTVARIAQYAIMFFTVAIVLTQLNIGEEIIKTITQILLGAMGLALALAFGLGGKDWAAGILDKYAKK
ncbi:MAG: hypothetical protein R2798_11930 [Chitinophagales bacterium]|nr:hypothetical protein [Bacteroidota bacterium]MCB9043610.1 hypothetical protein [Chitinophagales bacterium]